MHDKLQESILSGDRIFEKRQALSQGLSPPKNARPGPTRRQRSNAHKESSSPSSWTAAMTSRVLGWTSTTAATRTCASSWHRADRFHSMPSSASVASAVRSSRCCTSAASVMATSSQPTFLLDAQGRLGLVDFENASWLEDGQLRHAGREGFTGGSTALPPPEARLGVIPDESFDVFASARRCTTCSPAPAPRSVRAAISTSAS
jgi:hypothetical protein